jgi:hypothetical protein
MEDVTESAGPSLTVPGAELILRPHVEPETGLARNAAAAAQSVIRKADVLNAAPGRANDYELQRLVRTLTMWALAIRRLAASGPVSERAGLRYFADDPEHDQRNEDLFANHRAHLDVISYVTVGDMVLDDLAALTLGRAHAAVGQVPWNSYMRLVDLRAGTAKERPGETAHARYLDLLLRTARHRLVAHRLRRHITNFAWQVDGSLQLVMVGTKRPRIAERLLMEVNLTLPTPCKCEGTELRDWVIAFAPFLDAVQRDKVNRAFEFAGYEMFPPERVVEHVLGLLALLSVSAGATP